MWTSSSTSRTSICRARRAGTPVQGTEHSKPHTKRWAAKIDAFDAFVFVTPEYNHGTSGALENAIDFLYSEGNNKAAGFVSYGSAGGARAAEQLRLVMAELQIADVASAGHALLLYGLREFHRVFKPGPSAGNCWLAARLKQVTAWGGALENLRNR